MLELHRLSEPTPDEWCGRFLVVGALVSTCRCPVTLK